MATQTKSKGLDLAWIVVKDLNASIEYYTKILGLQLHSKQEEYGWAELGGERGARLGLAQAQPMLEIPAGANAIFTLTVDKIEAARQDLEGKGAQLLGEVMEVPGHVKLQMVRDPDGNYFQLVEKLFSEE